MPQERFLTADVLPVELVDRIQRKVRSAYVAVQEDPEQAAVVTVRFFIEASGPTDVDGSYSIEQKFSDKKVHEAGKIRDGQMVLPGTGLRSDDAMPPGWEDRMLALPTGRR